MSRWRWSLPFVFALLFWASYAPLDLGFLGWVGLVPLLVYAKTTSGKRSFFVAWLGGAVAFVAGFFWVRYTVPIGPLLLGLYKGLYVAIFVAVIRRLGALWTPVIWTALEYVRGTLFGGLPWFLLGYTQHENLRLIQVADLGGVWLVTALVAFVNGALVDGRRTARVAAAAAVALSFVYGAVRMPLIGLEDGPKIAVIQPNIPQDLKSLTIERPEQALENYRKHVRLTLEAAREKPDLIVWPEAAIYQGPVWDVPSRDWLRQHPGHGRVVAPAREARARTLVGALVLERDGTAHAYTNSALLVEKDGTISGRYDKVHLVPFSEFTPLAATFPWMRDLIHRYSGLRLEDMRSGTEFPAWEAGGRTFGTQICFEAIFPEISREIARKGAAFTVNISNDAWFLDSGELDQMLAMARFRAIENRTHVIRATNTGISAFIEPTGRHQAVLEAGGRRKEVAGVLTARVKVTGSSSLFRAWGSWVGLMAVGAGLAGVAWFIFVDRGRKLA